MSYTKSITAQIHLHKVTVRVHLSDYLISHQNPIDNRFIFITDS